MLKATRPPITPPATAPALAPSSEEPLPSSPPGGGDAVMLGSDSTVMPSAAEAAAAVPRVAASEVCTASAVVEAGTAMVAVMITLAAATLGWVSVPQSPVEAVIALSILFVAAEIVHWRQGRPGITRRKPWLVAFTFGLLHGFGFAGALTER